MTHIGGGIISILRQHKSNKEVDKKVDRKPNFDQKMFSSLFWEVLCAILHYIWSWALQVEIFGVWFVFGDMGVNYRYKRHIKK